MSLINYQKHAHYTHTDPRLRLSYSVSTPPGAREREEDEGVRAVDLHELLVGDHRAVPVLVGCETNARKPGN